MIDINKILTKHLGDNNPNCKQDSVDFENYVFQKHILAATKEILTKVLQKAADNATTETKMIPYTGVRAGGSYPVEIVDKQSILDTIKKIKFD